MGKSLLPVPIDVGRPARRIRQPDDPGPGLTRDTFEARLPGFRTAFYPRMPTREYMSETLPPDRPASGTTLQTLGGVTLAGAVAVAVYAAAIGDLVSAAAVLLYLPVGALLYRIGEEPNRL